MSFYFANKEVIIISDGTIVIDTKLDNSGIEKGFRNVRQEAAKLASEYKKAGMSSSEAWKKAWSEIERESGKGSNSVKNDMREIASVARKCAGILAGVFIIDKVKDYSIEIAKAGMNYNALSEQAEVAWTTILGSHEAASKMMAEITDYAAKTPFTKMGVDTMAKQLSNAGFEGQALFDQLTKIGDMGSAFGIQEDSLKEMVRQYAQVQQAQVAYTEDLNILQDRGIPIYKALGEVMGVPVSQVKKLASEGKVTADVYNKAIDSIASHTKGAMESQSQTFNGMMSTLEDNLGILWGYLTKDWFEGLKNSLNSFLPKFEDFVTLVGTDGFVGAINKMLPQLSPFVNLLSSLGSTLSTVVIPALISFGGWVVEHIQPIAFLASVLGGIVLAFKTFSIISSIIPLIQGLAAVFGILEVETLKEVAAQWYVNLAFLACPITWIVIAIGALVGAFVYLWTTSEGFRNFWIGMWEAIKNAFVTTWNAIYSFFTETIPGWIESLKNWFIGLPSWFGQLLENIKTWFITKWTEISTYLTTNIPIWINNIVTWFGELPYKIGYALGFVVTTIVQWGVNVWNYLVTNVPIWIDNVGNWFAQLPGKIWTWLTDSLNKVKQWGFEMGVKAGQIASEFLNNTIDWFSKLPSRIWTWLCDSANKVKAWGSNLWNAGVNAAKQLVDAVVNTVKSIPGHMVSIGRNIVEGIWNGITGAAGWFMGKVRSFFSGIVDGAKAALGIHSPSRVMRDQVGKWIMPGVEVGIDKTMPDLQENMKSKMLNLTREMKAKVAYESQSLGTSIVSRSTTEFINKNPNGSENNQKPLIINLENKNYLDSEEIAGHTTKKVIENISDSQDSYTISTGGGFSFA